jgi:hypothetical protein
MCDRSASLSVTGPANLAVQVSSGSDPFNTVTVDRITERSTKFCSSRMLPGHGCRATLDMNSSEMAVIRLCMRAA